MCIKVSDFLKPRKSISMELEYDQMINLLKKREWTELESQLIPSLLAQAEIFIILFKYIRKNEGRLRREEIISHVMWFRDQGYEPEDHRPPSPSQTFSLKCPGSDPDDI